MNEYLRREGQAMLWLNVDNCTYWYNRESSYFSVFNEFITEILFQSVI